MNFNPGLNLRSLYYPQRTTVAADVSGNSDPSGNGGGTVVAMDAAGLSTALALAGIQPESIIFSNLPASQGGGTDGFSQALNLGAATLGGGNRALITNPFATVNSGLLGIATAGIFGPGSSSLLPTATNNIPQALSPFQSGVLGQATAPQSQFNPFASFGLNGVSQQIPMTQANPLASLLGSFNQSPQALAAPVQQSNDPLSSILGLIQSGGLGAAQAGSGSFFGMLGNLLGGLINPSPAQQAPIEALEAPVNNQFMNPEALHPEASVPPEPIVQEDPPVTLSADLISQPFGGSMNGMEHFVSRINQLSAQAGVTSGAKDVISLAAVKAAASQTSDPVERKVFTALANKFSSLDTSANNALDASELYKFINPNFTGA